MLMWWHRHQIEIGLIKALVHLPPGLTLRTLRLEWGPITGCCIRLIDDDALNVFGDTPGEAHAVGTGVVVLVRCYGRGH